MEELNLEPPVLLVDGYNMCGYWPKLKKHFAKGDLETARSKLVVDLQTYGACKGRAKIRFSSDSILLYVVSNPPALPTTLLICLALFGRQSLHSAISAI